MEKYFAAALPDAARKSTREETFDLMEYVDSKVSCQMSWRWLQAKRIQKVEIVELPPNWITVHVIPVL